MFQSVRWWSSLSKHRNLWAWVRDTYTDDGLRGLIAEACDCNLLHPYDPFGELTVDQYEDERQTMRKAVKRLMKHYGSDIWSCCLGAGGFDAHNMEKVGLKCLSGLELAFQVYDQVTFEEFLVRNALKWASQQVLDEELKKG